MSYPLKQGLKRFLGGLFEKNTSQVKVGYPLKQGLKQKSVFVLICFILLLK